MNKQDFHGDVSQAVQGDVIHKAPELTLSNNHGTVVQSAHTVVVHTAPATTAVLQNHHWTNIGTYINEVIAIDPDQSFDDIREQLICRFGAEDAQIPVERYPDVYEHLMQLQKRAKENVQAKLEELERKRLVHEILRTGSERGTTDALAAYCLQEFGAKKYIYLSMDNLRLMHQVAMELQLVPQETPEVEIAIEEEQIPASEARTCPQCKKATWKQSRLCRICDFDLVRFDSMVAAQAEIVRLRKLAYGFAAFGVVCGALAHFVLSGMPSLIGYGLALTSFAGVGKALERIADLSKKF